ncbi:MAG: RNA polymerase sigma-70 factor (ECF subfamily) [Planctomycetota bacterium]|jgi:RNA polymerase sigma-70 factor (ECF subfamily)
MGFDVGDEELMLSYQAGDAASFEILYQRHKGGLYRYILRQCKSESITEELFQDVWMNLIKARERYEVKAKFSTWLYQMAHNRVIDHYRRQKTSSGQNPADAGLDADETPARTQDQPEHQVAIQAKTEHLMMLVDALPEEQKQAFLLREEAGMGLNEIAETCGINRETAKSRLRYAVNKLREGLSAYEPG